MIKKCTFRLDDIVPAMDWERFERLEKLFDRFGIAPLLGVVPDNLDTSLEGYSKDVHFWERIEKLQKKGWMVAQHGCTHEYVTKNGGILDANPFSEFAGLSYEEQEEKIKRGKEILISHGIEPVIFMAPGHTFDKNTLYALKKNGFEAVTDGYAKMPYQRNGLKFFPCTMSGPSLIRQMDTVCIHSNHLSDKDFIELELFMQNNKDDLLSFSRMMEEVPVRRYGMRIALEEMIHIRKKKIKNLCANSSRIQFYLQKSQDQNRWKKLCKRILLLPLLLRKSA